MNCLKSFVININQVSTFTGTDVKTWTLGVQEYWIFEKGVSGGSTSVYNIEGFKNINIYGIDVIGSVTTQKAAAIGGVIVEDWSFQLKLNGQIPLISGSIGTPNYWNIESNTSSTQEFNLSKNNNSLKFASPFQSVKSIDFLSLTAQGYGGQTIGTVSLDWDFSFIFFYEYEGE